MNNKKYLPLGWDGLFKKMYGDVNNTIKAENLIGLIFNIKSELLRGKVEILNNEMLQLSKDDKKQERDIVAKVIFSNEMKYINLEANIHSYGQILIDRNMGYISNIFANQLRSGEAYSLIAPTIQINFSIHDTETSLKDSKRVVSTYFLTNEYNEILTKKLQIIDIYIDNCYKIWYNDGIEEYNEYEQTIIRLGALHYITNNDEFRKCLGELKMDNDVKNMFQNDMNEYQEENSFYMVITDVDIPLGGHVKLDLIYNDKYIIAVCTLRENKYQAAGVKHNYVTPAVLLFLIQRVNNCVRVLSHCAIS